VRLFELYQSKCPANRPDHAFYLWPLQHPTQKQWYSAAAVGINTLANTVSRLCKKAGFVGFFSNHSLWAMVATRLFNTYVEEQLVKLKTGHTSDAVQLYKRASYVKLREIRIPSLVSLPSCRCLAKMKHKSQRRLWLSCLMSQQSARRVRRQLCHRLRCHTARSPEI